MRMRKVLACVGIMMAASAAVAADGVWTKGAGSWTNTSNWLNGVLPGPGDAAAFTGSGGTVTVPGASPFTLSALLFNTNGASVGWVLDGATNTLTGAAEILVSNSTASITGVLKGDVGLHKTGNGTLDLVAENSFTGVLSVTGGRVSARTDRSLGALPAVYQADAVVLNGGSLGIYSEAMTVQASRGVTAGAAGAYFLSRGGYALDIASPITGPGPVLVNRQTGPVVFSNPANSYEGDTIVGAYGPGYYSDGASATLRLGADEVIPDGAGKGGLVIDGTKKGVLDLNGKTETVNRLSAVEELTLANSAAQPGVLRAGSDDGNMGFVGEIQAGATLEKLGTGKLHFVDKGRSQGGITVAEGSLDFSRSSSLGSITVALDGGTLVMTDTEPGLMESVSTATGSINLTVPMAETGVRNGTVKGFAETSEFGGNTQYGYVGQWYVATAGTYSFAKRFDDGAYLALDGIVLLNNSLHTELVVTQNVAVSAGWHTVDVRFANSTGGFGPRSGFSAGIIFDPGNTSLTNAADIAAARRFEDPGDGSALRTVPLGTGTNTVRARLELAQDATFDRSGTAAFLVWAGDVVPAAGVSVTPVLTVAGGSGPFRVGATNRPAVFGVDVANANGVLFRDKVWLLSLPDSSSWSIAPGADVAAGTPGILGTGAMTLTDYSVRIPSSDALGAGGETVTVEGTGNAAWFDATRETDGRLIDDPAYAFTASNSVVFSGTGARVGFDGAGTVNYTGTISGNGSLVKTGSGDAVLTAANTFVGGVQVSAGRLLINEDAQLGNSANIVTLAGGTLASASGVSLTLARNIQATTGGLAVASGDVLTLSGALSGTAAKQGSGTLTLSGTAANGSLDLAVDEGVAVLDKSGAAAVRHILRVASNAVARLSGSGGNQIGGDVTLTGGTLDMNGRNETVGRLTSAALSSKVTNDGTAPSVLTVGEGGAGSTFLGGLADGPGGGTVGLTKTGTNSFTLAGAAGSQTATGGLRAEGGTLALGAGLRYVRFTPLATRTPDSAPKISEFQLLRDGVPVVWPAGTTATATSFDVNNAPAKFIDNNSKSSWLAGAAVASIMIDLKQPVVFNGYRWYTSDYYLTDPVSWTVEVSADSAAWFTADARTNQTIALQRGALAGTYAFNGSWPCDAAAAAASAYVASGAVLQVTLPAESMAGLTGPGEVALSGGSALRVADAGTFAGAVSGEGRLLLGGNAMLSVPSAATLVTAANDGAAPAAVTVGGAGSSLFAGALADGTAAATLGLTKRGSGTLALLDAGSTYTGDTRVEEGVLSAQSPMWTFRYVRFNPTQTVGLGIDGFGYPFSISEFQLMRNGQVVAYPAGKTVTTPYPNNATYIPANAVNGLTGPTSSDRWLSAALPNPLTIDMKSGVQFDSYRWFTAPTLPDNTRVPNAWTVEGSNDGVTWIQLDRQSGVAITPWVSGPGVAVGPFSLRPGRCKLTADFWAETNSAALKLSAVSARYLRFTTTETRWQSSDFGNTGFQLSELQLLSNGTPVLYPAGTTATAPGDGYNDGIGNYYRPSMAVDNVLPLGTSTTNRWYSDTMVNPLTVDMGRQVAFSGYRWYTGPNGLGRDPLSWTLEVSNNATNWYVVDVRTNQAVGGARNALAGTWTLDLPAGQSAADSIPNASRTYVASGATLRIDAASETVGPLSGTGTVTLVNGAAFGINGFADAAFAGGVAGTGTVTKTGAAVQTLSGALSFKGSIAVDAGTLNLEGATLTGVTNIVIRSGGELAGTAAVNGSLTLTFEGGVYSGNLAVSGTLTVTGPVKLKLPAGAALPFSQTLFTYASADAPTRAALAAAVMPNVPSGYRASVRVTDTFARLAVAVPGMRLLLK